MSSLEIKGQGGGWQSKGTVKVEGLRAFTRSLKAADEDLLKEIKKLNKDAATIAMEASARLAPRRTGKLAASLRASGTQRAGIVRAGGKKVPYANPIHWGWFKRHIKPQPFISKGAQDSEGRWLPLYEAGIDGIVRKIEGA